MLFNEPIPRNEQHKFLREVHAGNLKVLIDFKRRYPQNHWSEVRYERTGDSALHIAARLGHTRVLNHLLANYQPECVDCETHDGKTALHEAAQFAQYQAAEILLSRGACVNALKKADWTPLMLACTKSRGCKVVELLSSRGALVDYENKDGWSSLHLACREGNVKILYILIGYNVSLEKTTKNGRTALHIACLHGNCEVADALIKHGADVNVRDNCGSTPMHEAVLGGNVDVCRLLVSRGADIAAVNGSRFQVLHLAASVGHVHVVNYLVGDLGVDPDVAALANFTALHCAARKKHKAAFAALVSLGADASIEDKFGRVAREYLDL